MYRKFIISDEEGYKHEFNVDADSNVITVDKSEINMSLEARQKECLLIQTACEFMTKNTINKIEIEEITE